MCHTPPCTDPAPLSPPPRVFVCNALGHGRRNSSGRVQGIPSMRVKLKVAIVEAGCTQRALARELGMPEDRLSEIVSGAVVPRDDERERRLAQALGKRPRHLFNDDRPAGIASRRKYAVFKADFNSVPAELRHLSRWVLWKYETPGKAKQPKSRTWQTTCHAGLLLPTPPRGGHSRSPRSHTCRARQTASVSCLARATSVRTSTTVWTR